MKETEDNTNWWEDIIYCCIRSPLIVKMTILPKTINRFSDIPIKIPMAFFTDGARTNNFKNCMETQKILNGQSNLKKEQSWRNQAPWLQTQLQNFSHQKTMVLAQKQTHRSMEQNREPRNKPTHLLSINIWQMKQQ